MRTTVHWTRVYKRIDNDNVLNNNGRDLTNEMYIEHNVQLYYIKPPEVSIEWIFIKNGMTVWSSAAFNKNPENKSCTVLQL